MRKLYSFLSVMLLYACGSNLTVLPGNLARVSVGDETRIFSLSRLRANAGDTVEVSGYNLTKGMSVIIGGEKVELSSTDKSYATFIMPELKNDKAIGVTVLNSKDKPLATFALVSEGSAGKIPVMDVDAGIVCSDLVFKDPTGRLYTGTRNCSSTLPQCSTDGQIPCVTSDVFPPVNIGSVSALSDKFRTGVKIAGVSGTLRDCNMDGDSGCVAVGPSFAAAVTAGASIKIALGSTLAGVTGTATTAPANCNTDGATSCIATSSFPAADKSGFTSADLRSGVTIAGVLGVLSGSPAACSIDGDTGCIASSNFPAIDKLTKLSVANAAKIHTSLTIAGVTGTLSSCAADGNANCIVGGTLVAAQTTGAASKILSGQTLAGIGGNITLPAVSKVLASTFYGVSGTGSTGTLTLPSVANVKTGSGLYGEPGSQMTPSYTPDFPAPANVTANDTVDGVSGLITSCGAEGDMGCVVVGPTYAAAILSGAASKIITGQSVGGVSGNVVLPPAGKVLASTSYGVSGTGSTGTLTLPTASNVKLGSGLYGDPGAQVTPSFSPDFPLVANVRSNDTVDGITGTLLDCATDGTTGCVTTLAYKSADMTGAASKILFGQTLGGVAGNVTLPAVGKVLASTTFGLSGTGSTGTLTLPLASDVKIGSGLYGDAAAQTTPSYIPDFPLPANVAANDTVDGVTGTLSLCAVDGATSCVASASYPAAKLANFSSADIRSGVTIANVAGSLTGAPAACGVDGETGCISSNNFPAVDKLTKLSVANAAKIRMSLTIAGVSGTLADCASDGDNGCVIAGSYAAAQTTGAASKILFGQSVAGVAGNVTLPAVGKVLGSTAYGVSGTGSTGTLSLPSASNVKTGSGLYGDPGSQVTPSYSPDFPSVGNVRSGDTVDGATGALLDCGSEGISGCVVVGPTYVSAITSGSSADKILSGQSIAGVAGNVTLPAANKVLTATSFGVSGTGMTGSLTIPAAGKVLASTAYGIGGTGSTGTLILPTAANVKTGSGLYGDPSSQVTPSYSPDFPLAANVRSNDTVDGITGILLDCAADGISGCVTTSGYKSADGTGAASKILSGQTVGGVTGNVTLPAMGKVLVSTPFGVNGTGSTGTLTLPTAANVKTGSGLYGDPGAQITPNFTPDFPLLANVRSNDTVDGVTGTLLDCAADGTTGCVTTSGYKSAEVTGAAAKILSGQTVGGVAGNVSLPAVGKVLASTAFGVSGTGSTGTLTLPTAANVKTGSGLYGDSSAQLTPSYSPDFPLIANVRSNDTVDGVTGTLLDCAADGTAGCVTTSTYKSTDTTVAASKILSGQSVGGVAGNVTLPAVGKVLASTAFGVSGTGSTGTLTLPTAANVKTGSGLYGDSSAQLTPSYSPDFPLVANVRSNDTVDGVTGTLLDCAADGTTGCVTTSGYKSANTTGAASKILSGQTVGGVSGNVTLPAVGKVLTATAYGISGTGSTGTLTLPAAANVKTGSGLYGDPGSQVTPSYTPDFPIVSNVRSNDTVDGVTGTVNDCGSEGVSGCFVVGPTYVSATTSGSTADKIIFGQSIAGVSGNVTLPAANKVLTATSYGISGTGTTGTLTIPAVGKVFLGTAYGVGGTGSTGTLTLPVAANVKTGSGLYGDPGAQVTPSYSPDFPLVANVRSNDTVDGVTGTVLDCAADGTTNCVTTSPYVSANTTGAASKILSGQTVAGIAGNVTLPAAGKVLTPVTYGVGGTGSTGTLTLPAAANVKTGSGLYGDPGSQVTPSYSPDFPPTSAVRTSSTVNGVAGTLADCSADGTTTCVTTSTYKSANTTGAASKILSGQTVGGVAGNVTLPAIGKVYTGITFGVSGTASTGTLTLPSAGVVKTGSGLYGDPGAQITPSYSPDFPSTANVRANDTVDGATGTLANCATDGTLGCVTVTGYPSIKLTNLTTWDLRKGITAGGLTGSLFFARNGASLTTYNRTAGTGSNSSTTAADEYDSIDDYNNDGAIPSTAASGWNIAPASLSRDSLSDTGVGGGTASDGICNGTEACVYLERNTGLLIAKGDGTDRSWEAGITYCSGLNYGGYAAGWRLPTQKEMMAIYENGGKILRAIFNNGLHDDRRWTATTASASTTNAWTLDITGGDLVNFHPKTDTFPIWCVK